MGCSDSRHPGVALIAVTNSLSDFEVLTVTSKKADRVIRKYSPSPFVSNPQFLTIVSKLGLAPLSVPRNAFYAGMQEDNGFNRTHLLVSGIMQGVAGSREEQFRLLFEVLDVEFNNLVKGQKFRELVTAMVRVAIVYPLAALKPDSPQRASLAPLALSSEAIIDCILSRMALSRDVTYHELKRLLMLEGWRDFVFPAGLRKLVAAPEFLTDPTATTDSAETAEGTKLKRSRIRKKTDRGKRVSEHIEFLRSNARRHTSD